MYSLWNFVSIANIKPWEKCNIKEKKISMVKCWITMWSDHSVIVSTRENKIGKTKPNNQPTKPLQVLNTDTCKNGLSVIFSQFPRGGGRNSCSRVKESL